MLMVKQLLLGMVRLPKTIHILLIILFIFLPQLTQAATSIQGHSTLLNPSAYYKLDETSGVRYDSSNANNLNDNNTVDYAVGLLNNAADFERGNSEYLSITDANQTGFDGQSSLCLSFRIKFESVPSSGQAYGFIGKNGGTNPTYSWGTFLYNNAGAQRWYFTNYSGSAEDTFYVSWTPTTGVWYNISLSWTGSDKTTKFYVNGSQQGTNQVGTNVSSIQNTTSSVYVGRHNADNHYVDGLVDEFYYRNSACSGTEISDLYNAGTPLPYDIIVPPPTECIYINNFDMNSTTGQTCVTDGATTTCEYIQSPTSTPVWIESPDLLLIFGVILFLIMLVVMGFLWSPFKKM